MSALTDLTSQAFTWQYDVCFNSSTVRNKINKSRGDSLLILRTNVKDWGLSIFSHVFPDKGLGVISLNWQKQRIWPFGSLKSAVDGSKEAEYAFRKSIDVAKRNKESQLNLINVIDIGFFSAYDPSMVEHAQQRSETFLNDYKAQAEAEGLEQVSVMVE